MLGLDDHNPVPLDYAASTSLRRSRVRVVVWKIVILIVIAVAAAVEWFASSRRPHSQAANNHAKCASNLQQIGQALRLYANAHQGRYPDVLGQLMAISVSPSIFVCPASNDEAAVVGTTTQESIDHVEMRGHLSYIYLGKGMSNTGRAERVLVYEPISDHS